MYSFLVAINVSQFFSFISLHISLSFALEKVQKAFEASDDLLIMSMVSRST